MTIAPAPLYVSYVPGMPHNWAWPRDVLHLTSHDLWHWQFVSKLTLSSRRVMDGARGFLIDGGVRDTDELILEKVPVWSKTIAQTMVQVRLQYDAHHIPIAVGGVHVRPGDMVVADGDGVIVVPQEIAHDVAIWAHDEHAKDKQDRRAQYTKAGLAFDETL